MMTHILGALLLAASAWAGHSPTGLSADRAQAWNHYVHRDFDRFVHVLEGVRERAATTKDLYNLACGYALTGQPERALQTLTEVIARGGDFPLEDDPDLASLHTRPEFLGLVERAAYARALGEKLEPVRQRALAHYEQGAHRAFTEIMVTVAQLTNQEVDLYNLACGYALLGRHEEALALLDGLAERGADLDPSSDEDFQSLWREPRFIAIDQRMNELGECI